MPAGKIGSKTGGGGWVIRVSLVLLPESTAAQPKKGHSLPGPETLRQLRDTAEIALKRYQVTRKAAVTPTSRRSTINAITRRGSRFLADPENENWRSRFHDSLKCIQRKQYWTRRPSGDLLPSFDRDLRAQLHHRLLEANRRNDPPTALLNELETALDAGLALTSGTVEATRVLVDLLVEFFVTEHRDRDPALSILVRDLVPVWRAITGRSPNITSIDADAIDKHSMFAKWLCSLLTTMNLPVPPHGRVTAVVRHQNL